MTRHEKAQMNVQMQHELDAIDAALRGDAAAAGDASLADLARELQTMRPRPREEFVQALDARAAGGFRRAGGFTRARQAAAASAAPRRRRRPSLPARRRTLPAARRRGLLVSALGVAVTVALIAVVAVSQLHSGSAGPVPSRAATAAPTVSRPAVNANGDLSKAPAARAGAGGEETLSAGAATATPAATPRRIERSSTLDVGVKPGAIESSAQRVFTLVSSFNGYVGESNVSSGGGQGGASFDVRLPTSNLTAAIAALSHLGRVRSENDATNDVTNQFGSLQRSLGDRQAERASLLRQLAAAAEATRAAALKAQLQAVEGEIARAQGSLGSLRARIDYTHLSLSLTPEATGAASPGGLTPAGAARNAAQILGAGLAVLVIAGAAIVPLALLCIAGWIAVALTRRRLRERTLDAA